MESKTVSRTWNEFEDFNVGDQVKLRSGGPTMTVDGTAGSHYVCMWFDGNTFHRQMFNQGALEKVEKVEKPQIP